MPGLYRISSISLGRTVVTVVAAAGAVLASSPKFVFVAAIHDSIAQPSKVAIKSPPGINRLPVIVRLISRDKTILPVRVLPRFPLREMRRCRSRGSALPTSRFRSEVVCRPGSVVRFPRLLTRFLAALTLAPGCSASTIRRLPFYMMGNRTRAKAAAEHRVGLRRSLSWRGRRQDQWHHRHDPDAFGRHCGELKSKRRR